MAGSISATLLKPKLRPYFRERHVAYFIDRDQLIAAPAHHYPPQLELVLCFHQFVYKRGGRGEPDPPFLLAITRTAIPRGTAC